MKDVLNSANWNKWRELNLIAQAISQFCEIKQLKLSKEWECIISKPRSDSYYLILTTTIMIFYNYYREVAVSDANHPEC